MKKEKEVIRPFLNFNPNDGITEVLPFCTTSSKKKSLYAIDPYYREGFEHTAKIFREKLESHVLQISAMLFKPDAIVSRKIHDTISFLIEKGFTPIAFDTFSYNKYIIREDWRYQYNVATRNRIRVVDYLLQTSPSLIVFFKKTVEKYNNACEEMTSLKGHSNPKYRKPDDLRYRLKSINSLLNFIHTCDEPADMFRSLGLYFDETKRSKLLNEMLYMKDVSGNLKKMIANLYETYEEVQFNYETSIKALKNKLNLFNNEQQKVLKQICENPYEVSQEQWEKMYAALVLENPNGLSKWEINVLLTSSVKISIDNKKAIIN